MLREIVGQHASNHLAFTIFWRLRVCVFSIETCVLITITVALKIQILVTTLKIIFHYAQVLWRVGSSAL